jgi:hypothetical protein
MKNLLIAFLLFFGAKTMAQDSTYVRLELKNGKTIGGQLIQKSETEVSLSTSDLGKVTIPWSTIKSMNMVAKEETDRLANPQPSRYFFAPSAIPLKKGDKYYQNALFLLNSFQAGITDHFSLGAGILVPFAIYITPKIGYQLSKNVHAGGGILFATSLIQDLNFGVGTIYGSFTYGSKEHNMTLNAGLGAVNENSGLGSSSYNWKFAKNPMFTISGMTRVSKKVLLISENWIFSNTTNNYDANNQLLNSTTAYNGILSVGVRIIGERSAFDIGFLSPTFTKLSAIPYLAYNIKF